MRFNTFVNRTKHFSCFHYSWPRGATEAFSLITFISLAKQDISKTERLLSFVIYHNDVGYTKSPQSFTHIYIDINVYSVYIYIFEFILTLFY